jgi:hypothetical protein
MVNKQASKIFFINLIIFIVIFVAIFVMGVFVMKSLVAFQALAQEDEEEEDITAPKVFNISIQDISATSSVVAWETNEVADSLINYGLDKDYGVLRDPRYDKIEHKLILENLLADTEYYFRITSTDASGNQGISSDYTFTTVEDEKESFEKEGLSEDVLEEGEGGLSTDGLEEILQAIQEITSEEALEIIEEEVQEKAEEIVAPPTIILDYANIEIGTDYVIITWETDKDSNSIVALANEDDYNETLEDPYVWREGNPDEQILEHVIEVNGLSPATTYHFQVSSESLLGLTGRSRDKTFRTKSILPEIFNLQVVKVEEESATIRWSTNVPCSTIVEYTNLNTNEAKLEGNSSFLTVHSMRLSNLIFDTYYSFVARVESEEGEKAESIPMTFITVRDEYAPVISKVNTESTIYPGSDNKIQTIASWFTDEPAQCQLFYHQGLIVVDEPESLLKEEDYTTKHVQVITNFLPSTVYKFWIVCNDEANNIAESEDFTMLTPTQEESIIDIIIKNFESSFGWVKKLKI